MKKVLLSVFVIIAFSAISFGQSANALASGTVSPAQGISHGTGTDLNFGNFIADPTTAGTVTVTPTGSRSNNSSAVTLAGGTVSAAQFTVTGANSATYSITLPASALTLTGSNGGTMTVDTWVSNPAAGNNGVITGGYQYLNVGATINVGANQTVGVYTNDAGFDVTVAFN